MVIHLLTNLSNNCGTTPTIQDLDYWIENGYRFIAYLSDGAITLCKSDVGDIGGHCGYSPNVFKL